MQNDIYTLLYIDHKDLMYSRGSSTQFSVMTYLGKSSKKVDLRLLWWTSD